MVFTTVMNFPIHSYPHDYWRFTPQGIETLLEPCEFSWVDWLGDELHPVTLLGIGGKTSLDLSVFTPQYEQWRSQQQRWHLAIKAAAAG